MPRSSDSLLPKQNDGATSGGYVRVLRFDFGCLRLIALPRQTDSWGDNAAAIHARLVAIGPALLGSKFRRLPTGYDQRMGRELSPGGPSGPGAGPDQGSRGRQG